MPPYGSSAEPRLVPTFGHNGVAEVAEGNQILQGVTAALGTGDAMVCVELAIGIAESVAANLAPVFISDFSLPS
jgi:hypothetical protein